jgi:hypothetical protein
MTLQWLHVRVKPDRCGEISPPAHRPPWADVGAEASPRAVTSISHVVLVFWKAGKQIQAEELIRPAVRGFVGTIPGVLAVVEGHSTSPKGWRMATTTASSSPSPRRRRVTPISTTRITARSPRRSARPPSGSSSSTSDAAWV